jgi:hypothetical protein
MSIVLTSSAAEAEGTHDRHSAQQRSPTAHTASHGRMQGSHMTGNGSCSGFVGCVSERSLGSQRWMCEEGVGDEGGVGSDGRDGCAELRQSP